MQDEQELAYQAVGRGEKGPGGGHSRSKGLQVKWCNGMRFIYTVTQRVEEIIGDEIGEGELELV